MAEEDAPLDSIRTVYNNLTQTQQTELLAQLLVGMGADQLWEVAQAIEFHSCDVESRLADYLACAHNGEERPS